MENFDLIIGIHSIACALKNPNRSFYRLVGTEDAIDELKKLVDVAKVDVDIYSSHKVQEEAKKYFKDLNLEYQRVPSGVFLVASELKTVDVKDFYSALSSGSGIKILCLDQITDVHNAAAILRTANFYGVNFVVIPDKRSFGFTPSFFRIASGATEYVNLIRVTKLPRTIAKIQELGVCCIALSEHAKGTFSKENEIKNTCLILGREDVGISNAVLRLVENHMALESMGETKSLNVSIAAAVSMEKCFGKN